MNYQVSEVFLSVQGEGFYSGVPMCFVRLSGCNLHCSWCDTDHSPSLALTHDELLDLIRQRIEGSQVEIVCLTGGEPTLHDLDPLVTILRRHYLVHLETNGTRKLRKDETPDWITVSPKFPPGLGGVKQRQGHELKLALWSGLTDQQVEECSEFGDFPYRFLQPVDGPEFQKNAKRCLQLALHTGEWWLSFQGHKRLGLL